MQSSISWMQSRHAIVLQKTCINSLDKERLGERKIFYTTWKVCWLIMCCWLIKCIKRIGTAAVNRSDFNDREFFWIKQDRLRRGKETNLLDRLRKSPGAKLIYCEGSLVQVQVLLLPTLLHLFCILRCWWQFCRPCCLLTKSKGTWELRCDSSSSDCRGGKANVSWDQSFFAQTN